MAKLSDLPPEMIRHIGSFLCPHWPGELILDHGRYHDWVWDVYEEQNDNWESLFNFSYTSRVFKQTLTPVCLQSVGLSKRIHNRNGDKDVRKLFDLLRLLLHNPAASCSVVRKLLVSMPSEDYPCESFDLSRVSHQRDMQLLEEAAQSVGFDIWKETFAYKNDEASGIIGEILTAKSTFQVRFLKGFLVGLLILHLWNVRDLTVLFPAISLMAMTNLLRRVQRLKANDNEGCPILHLHSVAICTSWCFRHQWPGGLEALFSLRPQASVYLRECRLDAPLTWSSRITSLALRDMEGMSMSTLTSLILNCSRLKRFVYTHDVDDGSDIPSPGAILQALKKHGSSLEVLCLNFHSFGDPHDALPSPYIDSFNDFQSLEALWINCACFGDLKSSVLRTIPTSLNKLHLAGEVGVVADDLEWWAETLTSESSEEEDIDPLAGWGFSSDDESEESGSQDGKGDSHDQAEDEMDIEEDFSEQEEEDMNGGEVGENEFEEDEHGQDKNDLESYGEDVCEEQLCEEDTYTEEDSEYEAYEESEGKHNCEDEHQDKREDEQDRDNQDENQQNENEQADNQTGNQEDSQESEDETDEDSDKENEGEDEVDEKRPNRIHIPSELAYDADIYAISDRVTEAFLNDELIDFRDCVDSEPGQWYS